jgi:hypothetical protein
MLKDYMNERKYIPLEPEEELPLPVVVASESLAEV